MLSIGAINDHGVFQDFHLCEGEFSRAVIAQSRNVVVLADHTKFGTRAPVKVCEAIDVDLLITNRPLPRPLKQLFARSDTRLLCA